MDKEEIKHFKSMLRQGTLRHMNILLDGKFQSELLNIIKDYEKLQQENQKYKEVIDKAKEYINDNLIISSILDGKKYYTINNYSFDYRELLEILEDKEVE